MNPQFTIFQGQDDQWYWRLQAANGQIVASSEGYVSKANARRGVGDMVETVMDARRFLKVEAGWGDEDEEIESKEAGLGMPIITTIINEQDPEAWEYSEQENESNPGHVEQGEG